MASKAQYSVAIIGGGMVGLACASALAKSGMQVAIIEKFSPKLSWQVDEYDARVSAINLASQQFLDDIGCWQNLNDQCVSALRAMRVWDGLGGAAIELDSADVGQAQMGFIVENRDIVRSLWQQLDAQDNVTFFVGQTPQAVSVYDDDVELKLDSGECIQAQLIIGADGGNSWLRKHMQTQCSQRPYHHHAIVAVVESEKPHRHIAYQNFTPQGPLGILPLANPKQMAFVWSSVVERAEQLMAMSEQEFEFELMNTLELKLGKMNVLSQRRSIPLIARHAQNYVNPRLALIGDAAHTIHPLAGQGVNLGFMDAAYLAELVANAFCQHADVGEFKLLRRYERGRKAANKTMQASMRGFKELFADQSMLTVQARSLGINATNKIPFIKNQFIRYAMGV